ncbi:MAG TPA: thiamine ABC transporter substrate-binding protein [Candidatus Thermoplasmatota archaeon]|jgi:thiamine transport system substrate-binding protein|nr:thiamine ABC transporter substrate-binding protein [Candidatus Thermoplasmatota archaeon]
MPSARRAPLAVLATMLLVALALAGCTSTEPVALPGRPSYQAMGFDGTTWPDLHGAEVRVLAYPFSAAFDEARQAFANLTNGTAVLLTEDDTGRVLERALREQGQPSYDVIYGVDNVLMGRALRGRVYEPYQPLLSARVPAALAFVPGWAATPVNHGYIAVNVDPRSNVSIRDLDELKAHAAQFVTEDPRTSTPGLGFLVATVATYGEDDDYDYLDYWRDLLAGGATVTADWTQAYVDRFSGGYGQFEEGHRSDKPVVTSYTTSPAYEVYYGYDTLNANVLAPRATFHQIQTMGIARGTPRLAAAQAWVEFTLTDAFQELAAKGEAIYPIVPSVGTASVYQGKDPAPGTFQDAGFSYEQLDAGVARWVAAWTDAYERART